MARGGSYFGGSTVLHTWGLTSGQARGGGISCQFSSRPTARTKAKAAKTNAKALLMERQKIVSVKTKAIGKFATFAAYRAAVKHNPKLAIEQGFAGRTLPLIKAKKGGQGKSKGRK